MQSANFLRNSAAVACLIIIAYLSFSFFSGRHVNIESLQGTWSSLCGQYELTFTDTTVSSQTGVADEFSLRGNSITFSECGVKHRMRVSSDHLVIGETMFFRACE